MLVILALGVCGMHTLGHLDSGHGRVGGATMAAHGFPADEAIAPMSFPAADFSTPVPRMPELDPTSVCVAVLTSLLLLALATLRTRARRIAHGLTDSALSVLGVTRPPPRSPAERLAQLSVLRL
ncbi:hypothetical protein [Streptosporangium sp. KLBMP 9127]|nr:hypothetical protein [Streptosporangium sp. KLBMP 9127]